MRGMLVGIVAGLLSFAFLKIYGEPQVDISIAFEEQMEAAKAVAAGASSAEEGPELVSRKVQAGLGLFTAVMAYSVAFGGLFGLAYAFAYRRIPGAVTPQGVSILLAATGFVAINLVPNLKYPANPPSVGDPETIGMRTALYFIMIAISIAAMIGALSLKRLLVRRLLAGRQRSPHGVSRGGPVEVPCRLDRRAVHSVGYARCGVWSMDAARRGA